MTDEDLGLDDRLEGAAALTQAIVDLLRACDGDEAQVGEIEYECWKAARLRWAQEEKHRGWTITPVDAEGEPVGKSVPVRIESEGENVLRVRDVYIEGCHFHGLALADSEGEVIHRFRYQEPVDATHGYGLPMSISTS